MKVIIGTALLALALGGGATAMAQSYPPKRQYHHAVHHQGGQVLGPAYGREGEPLGPAYWGQELMPNPRTCGPGACQDNPRY